MSSTGRPASPAPSTASDGSTLRYGSEFGGSIVSGLSQRSAATNKASASQARSGQRAALGAHTESNRHVNVDAMDDQLRMDVDEVAAAAADAPTKSAKNVYIWGTRVEVSRLQKTFTEMMRTFCPAVIDEDETTVVDEEGRRELLARDQPYYLQRLDEINASEVAVLNLNLQHVLAFHEPTYRLIVAYPAEAIPHLDVAINELFQERYKRTLNNAIAIRPFGAQQTKSMRELNPDDIDQLISIDGMVTRASAIIPQLKIGVFKCVNCNETIDVYVDSGRIEEPTNCANCRESYTYQLIHNRSTFTDKQVVKLQETPGAENNGQNQQTITLYVYDELVESVHPGDRISITGIYRGNLQRAHPFKSTLLSVLSTSIDILHIRKMNQQRLHNSDDGSYLTEERIAQIHKLSQDPDLIQRLCTALAPQIFGHDDVKQGLLCQLFGGTEKPAVKSRNKIRSQINVLLCGDPGTAKSQLLQYIYRLMPRSQYTSGKGSSAVGLTASIARDPEAKGVVLQPGALVMADNGVCCIDEFDKMSDTTRTILHEVMEQQTLSIAKAGIVCQLNARASVLAAANPIGSKWNAKRTIVENIALEHTLLSRFDLIFLVIDPKTEEYDRRLARHLINFYVRGGGAVDGSDPQATAATDAAQLAQGSVDMTLLRDYIAYAKQNIHPKISPEADKVLIEKYLELREMGTRKGVIGAYPRQLQSLVRLSESNAKMHLKEVVDADDVKAAYKLFSDALRTSAIDPNTGLVDVGILATGVSATARAQNEAAAAAAAATEGENMQ